MAGIRAFACTIAIAAATGGCRQILGIESSTVADAALPLDTPIDTPLDTALATDAPRCYGAFQSICLQNEPTGAVTLNGTFVDTDASSACDSGVDRFCAIAARSIVVTSTVAATGQRPLVLIAIDTLTVQAGSILDAGSRSSGVPRRGAGSDPAQGCGPGSLPGSDGGGAGGSLGGRGGNGGGTGGSAEVAVVLSSLRGGCRGQQGAGPLPGAGGGGGGAVYLIANRIVVGGAINAGGAGGSGGVTSVGSSGGGGGGSGGVIVLDAPVIQLASGGRLFANGGGGGQASGPSTSGSGTAGTDATDTAGGTGGSGATGGSAGGNGSFGSFLMGQDGQSSGSGGGAGGGAGVIRILGQLETGAGTISPPAT